MVPAQTPPRHTSTVPSEGTSPSTSLTSPSTHSTSGEREGEQLRAAQFFGSQLIYKTLAGEEASISLQNWAMIVREPMMVILTSPPINKTSQLTTTNDTSIILTESAWASCLTLCEDILISTTVRRGEEDRQRPLTKTIPQNSY